MKPLTLGEIVWLSLLLTLVVEGATVFCRFGLGLEATQATASTCGRLFGGVRVHHGYMGVAMLGVAAATWRRRRTRPYWLLVLAVALVLSDAIHHFLVLWPIVGSPQFDLLYPP